MTHVSEIAPDVYRISVFVPEMNLQFNHFLLRDEEPMLYHAGMRRMFPLVYEALSRLIAPRDLRWIGFSHFEVDECGALNEWLGVAPQATPVCSEVGALVNMGDFADRPARALADGATFTTGRNRYRFIRTPHLPHGWDAGVLFEETNGTLLCSDLLHQNGDVTALTDTDILSHHQRSLMEFEQGPLMGYSPYTSRTASIIQRLADLNPRTLATMHGSSFNGDCRQTLEGLDQVLRTVWEPQARAAATA
ncbi:flavorubredoxin [Lewinella marina]|uniref:MBL fold metallo-hydrolase n=1 Tax=Neolewinella marina TaxID=438751 RepID=A0A2G0CFG5_9BACT|nr:MBL fold metallo-hydrolase [Neolewinella marina]NJB85646.1 flavorubredoxin [Neolewinella marina]PHK98670.1 MBL fold metallo-hydrolase [Neolewinella marina]